MNFKTSEYLNFLFSFSREQKILKKTMGCCDSTRDIFKVRAKTNQSNWSAYSN